MGFIPLLCFKKILRYYIIPMEEKFIKYLTFECIKNITVLKITYIKYIFICYINQLQHHNVAKMKYKILYYIMGK